MAGHVTADTPRKASDPQSGELPNTSSVDPDAFRDVIGRFASGVTIVSTMLGDRDYGTTVSACTSLSLEPPMLAVCLNCQSSTRNAILATGRFGVSILTADQADVAAHFARKGDDKFDCLQPVRGPLGMPLIGDSLGRIECDVVDTVVGGSHTIVLGCVRYAVGVEGEPLTYFRGRLGRFEVGDGSPAGARTS